MKRFSIFLFFLFLVGCTQEPADIMYNDRKVYSKNNYLNYNYNRGVYRTAPDGRVIRDISMREELSTHGSVNNNYNSSNGYNSNNNYTNDQSNRNTVNRSVNKNEYEYVIVKPEDSLYRIAKNNNVGLEELVKLNNIDSSYNIVVGQKIIIPRKDTSYNNTNTSNINTYSNSVNDNTFRVPDITKIRQNNGDYHIVNKGETLYSISKAYNVDMDEIIKANNLVRPYNLALGQRLLINRNEEKKPENTIQVVKKTTKIAGREVERVDTNNNNVKKVMSVSSNNFIWPIKGELIKRFGDKINDTYHDGINIKSTKGTAIKASKNGEVAYSGNELKGYGNIIILRHTNNWLTIYAHCDELKVRQGDSVKQGDVIATVGSTGNVDDNQLYFSIREGRETKDPLKFLK